MTSLLTLADADALREHLDALNEDGQQPTVVGLTAAPYGLDDTSNLGGGVNAVGHAAKDAPTDGISGPSGVPAPPPIKALSLTRPWTWLVLHGGKDVENRVWQTAYHGPLLIHGALSKDARAVEPFLDLLAPAARAQFAVAASASDRSAWWTGLLGVVDVIGCCTVEITGVGSCDCGPWAMPDQAHWQLTNPRPFDQPILCKGALGLWSPPDLPGLREALALAVTRA